MVSVKTWLLNWRQIVNRNYIADRLDFRFVYDVITRSIFEMKHPNYPWITIDMINILENLLLKTDVGFEFGSGYSTVWFAKNTAKITSVEHDEGWCNKVNNILDSLGLSKKATLMKVTGIDELKMVGVKNYLAPLVKLRDNSLDYVFVDGIFRDECLALATTKIKSGGLLIMDNVDNYFAKNKISVSIRYKRDNRSKLVSSLRMKKTIKLLTKWRCIWTSSAIQDTALWIKP